jgi:hypothetical protein
MIEIIILNAKKLRLILFYLSCVGIGPFVGPALQFLELSICSILSQSMNSNTSSLEGILLIM